MSLHPEQIELTTQEWDSINKEAAEFTRKSISTDVEINWKNIYDLKRENLKLQLIISKFKANK